MVEIILTKNTVFNLANLKLTVRIENYVLLNVLITTANHGLTCYGLHYLSFSQTHHMRL
jgi:hypothetical protein